MSELQTAKQSHPKGLWVLFGTEMWERFNFYGMRTILTLFIVNALMMSKEQSSIIYGGFLGLCYLTPMLGGFVTFMHHGHQITGRVTTIHTDRPNMGTATIVDTVFVEGK